MTAMETVLAYGKILHLSQLRHMLPQTLERAEKQGDSHLEFLHTLLEAECQARAERRSERLLKQSELPRSKTRHTLELGYVPAKVQRQLPALWEGGFLQRGENVLLFGKPGTGKTHIASAIGHALIEHGHPVLFVAAQRLVQRLLAAKASFELERILAKLDRFACVLIDDIGYVQQSREEMEVLFTFLAERYERKSVLITSNRVFSEWQSIFKDPMTTAAAIDRLVHHCTVLELTGHSFRQQHAKHQKELTTTPQT